MATVLVGYFGTMATVFAAIMYVLASLVDSGSAHHVRPQPYRMSATARAMAAEMAAERTAANILAANTLNETAPAQNAVAMAAPIHAPDSLRAGGTAKAQSATRKARQLKLAREERRRERLAGAALDPGYSALGYAPESPTRIAAERVFSGIRSRR